MTDWKAGDYAVCVRRGEVRCPHDIRWLGGANPATDAPLKVSHCRDLRQPLETAGNADVSALTWQTGRRAWHCASAGSCPTRVRLVTSAVS
jgi:hypothetical protein